MPVNKLRSSSRGKAAIAAVLSCAATVGGIWYANSPDGTRYPAAVILAADKLIKPWEGLRLKAYLDSVRVPTICWGETKGVKLGMTKTRQQCEDMLYARIYNDYYLPETKCAPGFALAPIGVQASMISGAYNFGSAGWCKSSMARFMKLKLYREACEKQTAYNRAGGAVLDGLVKRREMGDAQRLGEAELCISGLEVKQ